jgi:hypothetical protein
MATDRSKALVSRQALERVLARAAELQNAAGDDTRADQRDSLTEAQVEELAKEVGLSPQYMRQALAEERARIEPIAITGSGVGYELFGLDRVGAQRVVRGKPERVLAALDSWMQKEEGLRVMRQRPDFIIWEPAQGFFDKVRRALGPGDYALIRANEVTATVVAVDDEFSVVRLEAVFARLRSEKGSQVIFGTVFGAAGTTIALVLNVMVPVAIVPTVVLPAVSWYASRRSHQHALQRALITLEQALDRIERGDRQRPSLMNLIEAALPPSR